MRKHVLLPHEHGKGPAADDHLHGRRDLLSLRAKIRVALAADVRVRLDLQPFPAAVDRINNLGRNHSLERTQIRMAAARLHYGRDDPRECYQSLFPG